MPSTMVIKVKYGKTLRRFHAPVNEDNELELDMAFLRAKISNLFNFQPDADFSLTYNDEDDDVVTLVDDEDLWDVMRQELKFLKIKVQLNNPQVVPNNNPQMGRSNAARSSGSSTPLRSPREPIRLQDIKFGLADLVKSAPEPIQKALTELSLNLTSANANPLWNLMAELTSKNPTLAELADDFGKMTLSRATEDPKSNSVGETSAGNKVTQSVAPKPAKNPEPVPKTSPGVRRPSVDLNMPPVDNLPPIEPESLIWKPVSRPVGNGKKDKEKKSSDAEKGKSVVCGTSVTPLPSPLDKSTPTSLPGFDFRNSKCPFIAPEVEASLCRHFYPYKRQHSEATSGVFHRGIRCDGCGVHPITGPRFKSKVKEDYDLCSVCVVEMGDVTEYARIDHPTSHRNPHFPNVTPPPPPPPPHFPVPEFIPMPVDPFNFSFNPTKPKLNSIFISDVTVLDGTVMAPSSRFTKIWKMRNNGTEPWTHNIRLFHIGGDKLSQSVWVTIGGIPPEGIPVGGEFDVAIDFVAPETSGQYISYWMLASHRKKFGQRVWAQIQVDADLKDEPLPRAATNAPSHGTGGSQSPVTKDAEFKKLFKPAFKAQPKSDIEQKFPINDSLFTGEALSPHPVVVAATSSKVSYPIVDQTENLEDEVFFGSSSSAAPAPVIATSSSAPPAPEKDVREEPLLKELADMGFKKVELNREALKMNRYDLEQSVGYLCGVLEWDPILDDLEEMGFNDTETNKKLLAKNNGSIKRVVMDLINGEK